MSTSQATESASRDPSAAAGEESKRLLVIMPALNEEELIGGVIRRIPREIPGIDQVDVVVIDDGSTDETVKVATEVGASVISLHANMGLGIAMQRGIDEAVRRRVDYAVNIDSDGQFDPQDIPRLLEPLIAGTADMASASRFKDKALVPDMPTVKRIGNWGMSKIVSRICGQEFADVSCGFRAYTRETMLQLVLSGSFTYTQESFILLAQRNLHIVEVPLSVRGVREKGKSRIASNLFRYAYRTVGIMYSCVRDFSPGAVFNAATLAMLVAATALAAFFAWHRMTSGQFSPHIWAGFLSAFIFGIGLLTFWMGQVAEMIARERRLQERQLYLLRKHLEGATPHVWPPR
jgi:glycosyltransferase involved in cell wall biosynthesis